MLNQGLTKLDKGFIMINVVRGYVDVVKRFKTVVCKTIIVHHNDASPVRIRPSTPTKHKVYGDVAQLVRAPGC